MHPCTICEGIDRSNNVMYQRMTTSTPTFEVSLQHIADLFAPLFGLLCVVLFVTQRFFQDLADHLVDQSRTKPESSTVTIGYRKTNSYQGLFFHQITRCGYFFSNFGLIVYVLGPSSSILFRQALQTGERTRKDQATPLRYFYSH